MKALRWYSMLEWRGPKLGYVAFEYVLISEGQDVSISAATHHQSKKDRYKIYYRMFGRTPQSVSDAFRLEVARIEKNGGVALERIERRCQTVDKFFTNI